MPVNQENSITAPILRDCFISIVIPVRDEADYLQKTLESFSNQTHLNNLPLNTDIFELIILLDNCRDNSEEIARLFKKKNDKFNLHIGKIETSAESSNSGFVRRLLMEEAFLRLKQNRKNGGIIMTTDGDTQVADDWIAANLYEINQGADAVGGRILFSETELAAMNPAVRRFHLLDEQYRLLIAELESLIDFLPHDAVPRHHQHFNGSFAVTTEIYEKAGGVPDVRCLEDVAFFQSLMRIDAKFRHSPIVRVYTSARGDGRTEAGLSTQINNWKILAEKGEDFLVESAEAVEKRLKAQNRLRQMWQTRTLPKKQEIEHLATEFCVSPKFLIKEIKKPQTFGFLLENLQKIQFKNKIRNKQNNLESVAVVVGKLRNKVEQLRSNAKSKAAFISS